MGFSLLKMTQTLIRLGPAEIRLVPRRAQCVPAIDYNYDDI